MHIQMHILAFTFLIPQPGMPCAPSCHVCTQHVLGSTVLSPEEQQFIHALNDVSALQRARRLGCTSKARQRPRRACACVCVCVYMGRVYFMWQGWVVGQQVGEQAWALVSAGTVATHMKRNGWYWACQPLVRHACRSPVARQVQLAGRHTLQHGWPGGGLRPPRLVPLPRRDRGGAPQDGWRLSACAACLLHVWKQGQYLAASSQRARRLKQVDTPPRPTPTLAASPSPCPALPTGPCPLQPLLHRKGGGRSHQAAGAPGPPGPPLCAAPRGCLLCVGMHARSGPHVVECRRLLGCCMCHNRHQLQPRPGQGRCMYVWHRQ